MRFGSLLFSRSAFRLHYLSRTRACLSDRHGVARVADGTHVVPQKDDVVDFPRAAAPPARAADRSLANHQPLNPDLLLTSWFWYGCMLALIVGILKWIEYYRGSPKHQFQNALSGILARLEASPDDPYIRYEAAACIFRYEGALQGDYVYAQRLLREAMAIDPGERMYPTLLARICFALNDFDEAVRLLSPILLPALGAKIDDLSRTLTATGSGTLVGRVRSWLPAALGGPKPVSNFGLTPGDVGEIRTDGSVPVDGHFLYGATDRVVGEGGASRGASATAGAGSVSSDPISRLGLRMPGVAHDVGARSQERLDGSCGGKRKSGSGGEGDGVAGAERGARVARTMPVATSHALGTDDQDAEFGDVTGSGSKDLPVMKLFGSALHATGRSYLSLEAYRYSLLRKPRDFDAWISLATVIAPTDPTTAKAVLDAVIENPTVRSGHRTGALIQRARVLCGAVGLPGDEARFVPRTITAKDIQAAERDITRALSASEAGLGAKHRAAALMVLEEVRSAQGALRGTSKR